MNTPRLSDLSDLTLDELWALLRDKAEALIRETLGYGPEGTDLRETDLSDFPVDSYGSWLENLSLRRQDMYGDFDSQ
jgi:hypothetical protein